MLERSGQGGVDGCWRGVGEVGWMDDGEEWVRWGGWMDAGEE